MFWSLVAFVVVSAHVGDTNATSMFFANDTGHIRVVGRTVSNGTSLIFDWSSVFIEVMYVNIGIVKKLQKRYFGIDLTYIRVTESASVVIDT